MDMEILRTPVDDLNILTYNDYYTRLSLLAQTVFKWSGLPNGIPERFIEKQLFNNGICAFIDDDTLGYMVTKCTYDGRLNVYDEPVAYNCYAIDYNKIFNANDCVVIRNNAYSIPTRMTIRLFAQRLTEVERTIDVNIKGIKTPIVITCDEKERLTLVNLMKKYDGNIPFIFGNKALNTDGIKAIKTDVQYVGDQLMIMKHDVWNEAMSFLGIANANTDKRERLITDEVNANNQMTSLSSQVMLKQREEAAKLINEKFGTNITVEMRSLEDVYAEMGASTQNASDFSINHNDWGKEGDDE